MPLYTDRHTATLNAIVPAASHRPAPPITYPDDRPTVVYDLVVGQCRPISRQDPEDRRRLRFGANVTPQESVHVVDTRLAASARDLR